MRKSCYRLKVAVTHLAREGDSWSFVSYAVNLSEWSVWLFDQQENSMASQSASDQSTIILRPNSNFRSVPDVEICFFILNFYS